MAAFFGRGRELEALAAAVARRRRESTRVLVTGALGIGVTRLFDELVERVAPDADVVVCRGTCDEPRSGVAYGAIRDALRSPLRDLDDERLATVVGSAGYDIVALLPELAGRLAAAGVSTDAPALDSRRQRGARVREALIGVLDRLAGGGSVVLIVEDLEHSDGGTRELVGALVRSRRRLPLTLLLGCHPEEIGRGHPARPFLEELSSSAAEITRIALEPLPAEEVAALAEEQLGERPTLAFLAALMEGSRGIPLLADQLIAAQQELAGARLSDPLEQTVDARLEQLDGQQVRILRLLAAARRPLPAASLSRLTLPDGHLPRNAIALVRDTGLVTESDGGVAICHQLVAEAIEDGTLPTLRHGLHSALARLLQEPAEVAWHWRRAGRLAEARAAHIAAGRSAARLEPGSTALAHVVAALEIADDRADDVTLLSAAAEAADVAGYFRRAASLCAQAIERIAGGHVERLMVARADPTARARAAALCRQLGEYRRSSGDSEGARQALEQAVRVAPDDAAERAASLAALAQHLMIEGDFASSASHAEQARAAAAAAGEAARREFAHATDTAAVDAGFTGNIDEGLRLLDEALLAARAATDLDEVMRCYANKTTLLDLDLRRERALTVVKEGITEAARNGLGLTYGAFLGGNAADIQFQLGRWTEAEAQCRQAMEFPPAGVAWFSPILYLGLVLVESRADEEAEQLVGRTLLQLQTVPAGQWSALVLRTAVSLALWRGNVADALVAAEQGWQRVLEAADSVQVVVASATVLEACAEAADRGRARRDWSAVAEASTLAGKVLPVAEQDLARHPLPTSVGARREAELYIETARALNERVRGRSTPETWSELAERWARIPVPYQVAKMRWWQCQAALPTRSRREEARRALHDAWKIAGELPAEPLRAALRDLAQRGRITLPDEKLVAIPIEPERDLVAVGPGPSPSRGHDASVGQPPALARFGLSPREFGVLLVLAEGRTNREIAERLFISERTVAVHVRRILSKLGVSGRVEAAGVAIRLGLLPDDPRLAPAVTTRR